MSGVPPLSCKAHTRSTKVISVSSLRETGAHSWKPEEGLGV